MESSFIERIYEAAVVPEQWPDLLATLTREIGAQGTVVIVARGTDFVRMASSSPAITHLVTEYSSRYPKNQRIVRLLGTEHAGFLQDSDLMRPGEVYLDRSYEEYLIPEGYGAGTATVINAPSGDNLIIHSEFRYTGQPIGQHIIARMDTLRPHFARAALLSSRLGMERARGMTNALEAIGLPAAVLRWAGSIYVANGLFQPLVPLVAQDRRDRIVLTNSGADGLLSKALAQYRTGSVFSAPASIPIAAEEGRPPMIVHLVPVRGAAHDVFSQSAMLLLVTPVDRAAVPAAEVLQGLFDLTPAEARVARGIAGATSIDALATAQGVTRETVRSQLKAVLAKTGLNRQSELVSLLAGAARIGCAYPEDGTATALPWSSLPRG